MALENARRRLRRLVALQGEYARLPRAVAELRETVDRELPLLAEMLQLVYDDEPGNRRRLAEMQASDEYEAAFTEAEPLVSVVIPTYTSYETLRDRAIPSILTQTYQNFEIVIVGDVAPPETAEVIASFDDGRIVYENLLTRGPYPEDPFDRWNVSGVPAYNRAVRKARGRWISPFADDDMLRRHALETTVIAAQKGRFEVCYGVVNCVLGDGREVPFGVFPPVYSGFGLQGGVYHSGLRFVEHELADALFGWPHDWSMVRRMLRAGVRFGYVEEVLCDYFPTSNPRGGFDPELFHQQHAERRLSGTVEQ